MNKLPSEYCDGIYTFQSAIEALQKAYLTSQETLYNLQEFKKQIYGEKE